MIESRLPCPVCLGVHMVKESSPHRSNLTLDLCRRCGGIWFETGEFQQLRSGPRFELAKSIHVGPHTARCQKCLASIRRDAERCSACGASNLIDCPRCCRPTRRTERDGLVLDVCSSCHGIWFDRHEIAAIWTLALAAAVGTHAASPGHALSATGERSVGVLEALTYSPDLGVVIIDGSLRAAGSALEGISAAPEAVSVVVEAAGTVFEALVMIVGAVFEGLS